MNATGRFTDRAAAYAVSRPSYGADALDFIVAGMQPPLRVADVGAGTGISSRLLAARGAEVWAIEPNAAMREQAQAMPGVHYLAGTGEATGLPDAAVDLVTAFQAFHWFANPATLAECRRIVRPAGRAALVLNERDEQDPFTLAYGDLYRRYAQDDTEARRMRSIPIFKGLRGQIAEREFRQEQRLDRDRLWRRTISASYLPQTGEAAAALRDDLDAIFDRFADRATVRLALRTIVVRIDLDCTDLDRTDLDRTDLKGTNLNRT